MSNAFEFDRLQDRRRLADAAEADEARLARLLQLLQRRDDLVQRDLDVHAVVGVLGGQRIVQLEEIDVIHAEARQALVHRLRDELGDPRAVGRLQPELGAEHDVGLQRLQHAAEIALGLAVAVERGGVDVVDAELDGARDRPLLVGRRALGHQAADGAGAEAEHGNFEAGAAQFTLLHFSSFPFISSLREARGGVSVLR